MATSCGVLWKEKYTTLPATTNTTNPITNSTLPHENLFPDWIVCPLCIGGRDADEEVEVLGGMEMDDEDGGGVIGMVEGGYLFSESDRYVLSSSLRGWGRSSSARLIIIVTINAPRGPLSVASP